MTRHYLTALFLIVIATLPWAAGRANEKHSIEVKGAWVREAPPHAAVLGAYLAIENHSSKPETLATVSSPDFDHVEMHRSVEKNGMMQMIKQNSVVIPAGGKFLFKPGSYHLMLMKPKRALKAGDKVHLTLKFRNGSTIAVNAPVKKDTGGMNMEMHMDTNQKHSHDMGETTHQH